MLDGSFIKSPDVVLCSYRLSPTYRPLSCRVFVSDEGLRGGRTLPLKKIVDDACKGLESLVEHVFVFKRTVGCKATQTKLIFKRVVTRRFLDIMFPTYPCNKPFLLHTISLSLFLSLPDPLIFISLLHRARTSWRQGSGRKGATCGWTNWH